MAVFDTYARYYNLLYKDKDYTAESVFVLDLLRKNGSNPSNVLDLGCGTGRHGFEMALRGVEVVGVDLSETMLAIGRRYLHDAGKEDIAAPLPDLRHGDVREVRLERRFGAVVSLFHVVSYQTVEQDAPAMLATAREHLVPGGLFFFDFWHGPGVLRQLPEYRERTLEDQNTLVKRMASPELIVSENVVNVHYTVTVYDRPSGDISSLQETHRMRYWFIPELRFLAGQAGFVPVAYGGWMHESLPGLDDWNAWMLLRA